MQEGVLKDAILKILTYFHNPELVGSVLLLYVTDSATERIYAKLEAACAARRLLQALSTPLVYINAAIFTGSELRCAKLVPCRHSTPCNDPRSQQDLRKGTAPPKDDLINIRTAKHHVQYHMVSLTINIPHSLLNGLKVIIAPTEEAVLRLKPDSKGPRPEPLRQKELEGKDPDAYDKMNALGLVRMEISRGTLGTLAYFPEYESLIMWSLVAVTNFVIAQTSRCALPTKRPMGWATVTLCAALARSLWCNVRLLSLLGWDNDHSKFAIFCGFCGLFTAAAAVAMPPSGFFCFDLAQAARALQAWLGDVAAALTPASTHSMPFAGLAEEDFAVLFVPAIAVVAACVTASAALPSIRFAQFYQRALKSGSGATLRQRGLLIVDAFLPWVVTLVWIRPVLPIFLGEETAGSWGDWVRVGATGATVLVRLALARTQIQAFLEGAKEAVLQDLREKKVDALAVRTKFEARLQYLVIAAAQYAAPAVTAFLAHILFLQEAGGGGGGGVSGATTNPGVSKGDPFGDEGVNGSATAGVRLGICDALRRAAGAAPWEAVALAATSSGDGAVSAPAGASRTLNLPVEFWSGVMGFLLWWACVSWAATYALGIVFWRLYPEEEAVEERGRRDRTTKAKREKGKGKAKAKANKAIAAAAAAAAAAPAAASKA